MVMKFINQKMLVFIIVKNKDFGLIMLKLAKHKRFKIKKKKNILNMIN